MLPYFPFDSPPFGMHMGVQALAPERIIEVDPAEVRDEIRLKRHLLDADHDTYCVTSRTTRPLEWEVVATLLPALAARYPYWFRLHRADQRWLWHNHLLHEQTAFILGDDATLPISPLDWIGRQVQEDLLLLSPDAKAGFPLVAGVLCFPNMWSLAEKLGHPLLTIHAPVPGFIETLGRSTQLLLGRLKVGRPVWRLNWAILPLARLNLVPQFYEDNARAARDVTLLTAGAQCHLRIERQTLTRLPNTGAVLFTVHTYQTPLAALARHPQQMHQLRDYLTTVPAAMLHYKGIDRFFSPLMDYLAESAGSAQGDEHGDDGDSDVRVHLNVSVAL